MRREGGCRPREAHYYFMNASSSPHPSPLAPHPQSGTILAFDFGTRRIGVAVGDLGVGIAHPLTTIDAEDNERRFAAIAALVEQWRPGRFVVGLPLALDGAEHELTRLARKFAQRLEGRFGLPVAFVDERLSSRAAQAALAESGARSRGDKGRIDRAAAQRLLQDWLDSGGRVR